MRQRLPSVWDTLVDELHRWSDTGRVAHLFLRDDDACAASPQLDRLLAAIGDIPLGLAVIPGELDGSLSDRLAAAPRSVHVWQHGWTHANWAIEGHSEYPEHRPVAEVEAELARGKAVLAQAFGDRSVPVFVPPWSGFHPGFLPVLGRLGFAAFSGSGARERTHEAGVAIVNGHCEPIEWTPRPMFAEDGCYLFDIVEHLVRRRQRTCDMDEPTGIIWHHRVQDDKSYGFLSRLIEIVDRHKAACWCDPLVNEARPVARRKRAALARGATWLRPFWMASRLRA